MSRKHMYSVLIHNKGGNVGTAIHVYIAWSATIALSLDWYSTHDHPGQVQTGNKLTQCVDSRGQILKYSSLPMAGFET